MTKYIELEAVIKMAKPYWQTDEDGFGVEWLFNKEPIIFKKDVEAIPAADVAPVRHGRWFLNDDYAYINCSVCHYPFYMGFKTLPDAKWYLLRENKWKYCPNCGARMDDEFNV